MIGIPPSTARQLAVSCVIAVLFASNAARAQETASKETKAEPGSLQLLTAFEDVLSDVIARNEKSVVAIARMKKSAPGDPTMQPIPDPFNRPPRTFIDRSDPEYIPD